jgi:hypothetical protein
MLKFLGVVLLLAASFASGYYFGQRPVGTLQQTVSHLQQSLKELSRNVLDTTTGIERDLRRRQGLVDAKSRLVQAKANVFERNFGDAAKELPWKRRRREPGRMKPAKPCGTSPARYGKCVWRSRWGNRCR